MHLVYACHKYICMLPPFNMLLHKKVFDIPVRILYNITRVFARCAMLLNVQKIINAPGERIDFRFELDLSDVDFSGLYPAQDPVVVTGDVRNTAGMLLLQFTAGTVLRSVCDRCLKRFDNPKSVRCEYMLAERVEEDGNDEIVVLSDGAVDVGELARTAFILEMDAKTLCSEDCKGICPGCGVDLNQGSCTCKKEVDPRLAVLARLLEKDANQ